MLVLYRCICMSSVAVKFQGQINLEHRCCMVFPISEWKSCAVLNGNQASCRAEEFHFPATGLRLIFLLLLPSPIFPPPLGMIISPPIHRTIIFQVCSYPSLLSFFMACFFFFSPYAGLHICAVPVQYVKEGECMQRGEYNKCIYFLRW